MKENIKAFDQEVEIQAGPVILTGHLSVPISASGIVIFAHGSGSSRNSPRNLAVAQALNKVGLATLLFDLLTKDEELDRDNVFDIELLGHRLLDATMWLRKQEGVSHLPMGYFGASTGAAAALWAAADPKAKVKAIVSRGGRADMAGPRLAKVLAPTLLIVGGDDDVVVALNKQAQGQMVCENRLTIIPGATHLFEEPGALEKVSELACGWFIKYFA